MNWKNRGINVAIHVPVGVQVKTVARGKRQDEK